MIPIKFVDKLHILKSKQKDGQASTRATTKSSHFHQTARHLYISDMVQCPKEILPGLNKRIASIHNNHQERSKRFTVDKSRPLLDGLSAAEQIASADKRVLISGPALYSSVSAMGFSWFPSGPYVEY